MHKPKNVKEFKIFGMEDSTDQIAVRDLVLFFSPGQVMQNINCRDDKNLYC